MTQPIIDILLVEDNPHDAFLIEELLLESEKVGFNLQCFNRLFEALSYLQNKKIDLILLDLSLPDSHGMESLSNTLEVAKNIPVIVLTGNKDEILAVDSVKKGAQDYLVKGQLNSIGLVRSIQYAIERKKMEHNLRESKEKLNRSLKSTKKILESLPIGVIIIGYDKTIRSVNKIALDILGWETENEIVGKVCDHYICNAHKASCPVLDLGQKIDRSEKIIFTKDGKEIPILKSVLPINIGGENLLLEGFVDITSLRETHRKLIESERRLLVLNSRLEQKVMGRTSDLGERIKELSCLYDVSTLIEQPNITIEKVIYNVVNRIPASMQYPTITCSKILFNGIEYKTINYQDSKWKISSNITIHSNKIGSIEVAYLKEKPLRYEGPFFKEERNLINGIAKTLSRFIERKWAEKALRKNEASLSNAQRIAHLGNWEWDILKDEMIWSDEVYRIFGFNPKEFNVNYESFLESVHSDDKDFVKNYINGIKNKEKPFSIDHRIILPDGTERIISEQIEVLFNDQESPFHMTGTILDITERKRRENEIRESKEKLNVILSNIDDLVAVVSKDHRILYLNRRAEEEFGRHQIGNFCFKVLTKRDTMCEECPFNKIRTNDNSVSGFELELFSAEGNEKRYFDFCSTPILLFDDQPATIDILRDITIRKKAEIILRNSEEKYRSLVENLPYSIFLIELDNRIFDCNRFAELYINKSKEDLKGTYFFEIFRTTQDYIESIGEVIQNVIDFDLSNILEFEFVNKSNNKASVEVFFSSVEIGNTRFIQAIVQDITEKKLAKIIIQEENETLRKLDQIKKELTTKTSEELKSPLTIMFESSQVLLNLYRDKLDQNAIQLLELIRNGGEKSISLTERILDISRIESDEFKLNKQTESLKDIIEEAVNKLSDVTRKQRINLKLDLAEDLYSEVDKPRIINVIFDILMYNILNYSSKKGEILIKLKEKNNFAEISMENIGTRLKGKEKKKILSDKHKKISRDSFLGLHFSKEIINLHGGQAFIESEGNKEGVNYIIKLPIKDLSDVLLDMYVIYKSGILIYEYNFGQHLKKHDGSLISGSVIGMMTILREVMESKKQIKTIDHGDLKIMFELNVTKDVVFVLIVKDDLLIFRKKLNALIDDFDRIFKDLIDNIETAVCIQNNWESLGITIKKHFRK